MTDLYSFVSQSKRRPGKVERSIRWDINHWAELDASEGPGLFPPAAGSAGQRSFTMKMSSALRPSSMS